MEVAVYLQRGSDERERVRAVRAVGVVMVVRAVMVVRVVMAVVVARAVVTVHYSVPSVAPLSRSISLTT